ncbi:MAG TPA: GNAT family N-acetyltransferase [Actinospica sp.]|nr:GNAT family N-acetyltransferase [Actinospica sp.]
MSDLQIRPAAVDEAAAVLAFWAGAAEGTSISDDPAGVRTLIERDPRALILAVDGDRIVGTVIAGFDGWRCHLYRLAVVPDRRREGIGGALLDAAHARFAELGGRRADAMVLERNETGQRAWSAAGYVREDHWRRWVRPLERAQAGPPAP